MIRLSKSLETHNPDVKSQTAEIRDQVMTEESIFMTQGLDGKESSFVFGDSKTDQHKKSATAVPQQRSKSPWGANNRSSVLEQRSIDTAYSTCNEQPSVMTRYSISPASKFEVQLQKLLQMNYPADKFN